MRRLARAPLTRSPYASALGISLAVLLAVPVALSGCGGAERTTASAAPTASARSAATHPSAPKARNAPLSTTTPERSPGTERPQTDTQPPAAVAAREAGQKACRGVTPREVAKRYEQPAQDSGVDRKFAELVANPPATTQSSKGYPRLVAALYASTVPVAQRAAAAAGCAEELGPSNHREQASPNRAK